MKTRRIRAVLGLLALAYAGTVSAVPIFADVEGVAYSTNQTECSLEVGTDCGFAAVTSSTFSFNAGDSDGVWGYLDFTLSEAMWLAVNVLALSDSGYGLNLVNSIGDRIDWSVGSLLVSTGDWRIEWKAKGGASGDVRLDAVQVAEPASIALVGLGLLAVVFGRLRQRV